MSQPQTRSRSSSSQGLRELQQELNESRREVQSLRERLANTTNSGGSQTSPSAAQSSQEEPRAEGTTDSGAALEQARMYVRKYTTLYMLWCRLPSSMFPNGPALDDYSPTDRFKNDDTKVQGQLDDFNEMFPPALVPITKESWWVPVFKAASSQQRSNLQGRVRRAAGTAIFGCTEDDLKSSEARRERFGALIGLPAAETNPEDHDHFNIEVLHEPYHGKMDTRTIFLNPRLIKTLSAVLRGPQSIKTPDGRLSTMPGADTVCSKWAVTHTTPGAIAMACVLTRWAASPDVQFHEHGLESHIDWQAAFEGYLQYLNDGLLKEKSSVRNIFRTWDEALFPNSTTRHGQRPGTSRGHREDVNGALALLNAEEDEEM
ncbi:hypothetical protein PsYK624_059810 [Phanerochaete sordida]|uniref:Uncharacterized protein n=1 Tax=Phanerochaete sordida TaxID=48140 RepID=A0A9P3G8J3_9APHY|nr:hypothetical protein PsYK624_059810 [Phanerochaete sordida]